MSSPSPRTGLLKVLMTAALCCGACTSDGAGVETETETGAAASGAILRLELDAASLCTGAVERLELATRRRSCWDPELPCTSPTNPPWMTGTAVSCGEVGSVSSWEVGVEVSGQYETQLRALDPDGTQDGINCYADPDGQNGLTQVAKVDVEMERVFELDASPDVGCPGG